MKEMLLTRGDTELLDKQKWKHQRHGLVILLCHMS